MDIRVCSARRRESWVNSGRYPAWLSLNGDGMETPGVQVCSVFVHDVTPFLLPQKRTLMTGEQMHLVIRFLQETVDLPILINCQAGRSRSTASAVIAKYIREGRGSEYIAAKWLFNEFPKSTPNGWFLKLADAILGTHLFPACENVGFVKWTKRRRD